MKESLPIDHVIRICRNKLWDLNIDPYRLTGNEIMMGAVTFMHLSGEHYTKINESAEHIYYAVKYSFQPYTN